MKCDELKWKWAYFPYLDAPEKQHESAVNAGYVKVLLKAEVDESIAELKQKLESVQASMYCDVVDAGMENLRLKRALWLARANDASSFASLFSTLGDIEDDESRTYWIFGNKRKIVIDKLKCHRMETSYKWFCIWDNVASKCLKKAEECK